MKKLTVGDLFFIANTLDYAARCYDEDYHVRGIKDAYDKAVDSKTLAEKIRGIEVAVGSKENS